MRENIFFAVIAIVTFIILFVAIKESMKRQEVYECLTWKAQAAEIKGYWITQNQKDQCDAVDVDVKNIPIKVNEEK